MKSILQSLTITGLFVSIIAQSCKKGDFPVKFIDNLPNKVVMDWNLVALRAEGGPTYQHLLLFSRINAMVHIAMQDAINAIIPVYEQYAYHQKGTSANPITAAASAAYTVLKGSMPENADSRVRAGIHFRFSCDAGQKLGDKVGEWTLENYLRPRQY